MNNEMQPISGWKVHPKIARILVFVMMMPAFLALFSTELGLPQFLHNIFFSVALVAMSVFVVPQAKIWMKTK
jgi:hypothetical protein